MPISANSLLKEIGYKISLNTGESRDVSFLHQCTTLCRPLTARTEYRTRNCLASHNF